MLSALLGTRNDLMYSEAKSEVTVYSALVLFSSTHIQLLLLYNIWLEYLLNTSIVLMTDVIENNQLRDTVFLSEMPPVPVVCSSRACAVSLCTFYTT